MTDPLRDQDQGTPSGVSPAANPGIVNDTNSVILSGTERLGNVNVLPPVKVLPGAESVVRVEQQPEDQISVESPLVISEKPSLEINRLPGSSPLSQPTKAPTKEEKLDNPKIISFEDAQRRVKEMGSILPSIPGRKNSTDWLSALKVKSQAWIEWLRKKRERMAA